MILPAVAAGAALAAHLLLPDAGLAGTLRLAAGTAFWFALAWAAARLAAILLAAHPKLLSDLIGTAMFVAALLFVTQFVFELPATGLIATSSVLIAVLGFALRNTLGDIFSGIALGIEAPYAIGDWIEATEGCAGRVTEISWRTTKLVTRDGVTLVVPNSLIAGHRIAVYGSGIAGRFRTQVNVPVDTSLPADRARRLLLAAAMEAGRDLPDFAPDVVLVDLSQGMALYAVRFHVPDYGAEMRWKDAVAGAAQRALQRAGLELARPGREVAPGRPWQPPEPSRPATLLGATELFRPFTADERATLGDAMAEHALAPGATIVRQGEEGASLYLLAEGVLEVLIARPGGGERRVDRLFPGAVFGEMSLLTGQPRSATVRAETEALVFELGREALDPLLRARPDLVEGLTAIMAARQSRNAAGPSPQAAAAMPSREDMLARLKSFFGLR
ncbi:mechanosensitive ion channel family protein [Roseomonas sp. PWR1]|uniref:Small-conductance mechanosensitive channel n=1 Tax=Roseomonas nitratireducens TaxID=2820810 RepID=A0ABS4AXY8_9PROT|nr:mechanosensitive ion channel family protein [Neoroseomonas nitratireducens]MBP0466234.1 mechanosensitive ion channel family protein [Neoroseomonas nitratireducens]